MREVTEMEALPRVLFVDDEPRVLDGIAVQLRRRFEVVTATSGAAGLVALTAGAPFVVVVSDMRMPGMDGAAFLHKVRELQPDTVRLILTGYTDLGDAVRAVNDGYIFRLLTKPCSPDTLVRALDDAVEQYRCVTADRVLLERKLSDMSSQLIHAERLATLGTMTSGVAHELNNINTIFLASIDEVRERAASGLPPEERTLGELFRIGQHLRAHATQIMNMGRPGPTCDKHQDLKTIVEGTLGLLKTAGKTRHIGLTLELPEGELSAFCDRTRIEQILVNLIGNSVDALAGLPWQRRKVRVFLHGDEERATLAIEDTGHGIAPDKMDQIFEPYFTTKPKGKGTGLGLPVVKQIVESYGGTIVVTSKQGEGTRFEITLPRKQQKKVAFTKPSIDEDDALENAA